MSSGNFVFRKNVVIGAAAAEHDEVFLAECFIDTGDLHTLRDMSDHRRIVLGRTGAGKSAILLRLRQLEQQTIWIEPQALALNYISNSNVLRFFENQGVNLTPFYKLLWKHVLSVELLRRHFHLEDEKRTSTFFGSIFGTYKDAKTRKVLEYLKEYGNAFWEGTEFRIKEIVSKIEGELKGSIGAGIGDVKFNVDGSKTLSDEQKTEVITRGQQVVSQFQVRDLQYVLEVLSDDLLRGALGYYLVVDRLDEDWVDDSIQLRLIRALIDTAMDFRRVKQAKVLIGVRHDLLESVLLSTKAKGDQEEKIVNLCVPIKWNRNDLLELVNTRIDKVIRDQYTGAKVTHKDIFPETKQGTSTLNYILGRTADRPRDLIVFLNLCLARATGKPVITRQIIADAEAEYSRGRLTALGDEWHTIYPYVAAFADLFRDRKSAFILRELDADKINEFCYSFVINTPRASGPLAALAKDLAEDRISCEEFRTSLCKIMYRVGFLAIKPATQQKWQWMDEVEFSLTMPTVSDDSRVQIHPAYWRTLNIVVPSTI